MTLLTSSYSTLPEELFLKVCSELLCTEYLQLSCVCTSWNSHLTGKIWQPLLEIKFPFPIQPQRSEKQSLSTRAVIATFFQNNQRNIDFVIDQIKDDKELALYLHTNEWPLDKFKSHSPLERSRLMWKAIFQDATPVIVKLMKHHNSGFIAYATKCSKDINWNHVDIQMLSDYNQTDLSSPIVKALTLTHKVFYDKAEVICALMPGFQVTSYAWELLSSIVKSHEDLSKLNGRTVLSLEDGTEISAADSVITLCLQAQRTTVTIEDLVQCNLIDNSQ